MLVPHSAPLIFLHMKKTEKLKLSETKIVIQRVHVIQVEMEI